MSITIRNHEGWYEATYRNGGGFPGLIRAIEAATGIFLCDSPVLLAPPTGPEGIAGSVLLVLLLGAAATKLLAEASRVRRIRSSLHVASGELEVRVGRGLLARTRAFGAVEVDRFLLSRREAVEPPSFVAAVVPQQGTPVPIIAGDPDEVTVRDVALTFSQGMDVPLEDRRYDVSLNSEGAGPQAPARVAVFGEGPRAVFTWSYRDQLKPTVGLLALGLVAFLAFGLPQIVEPALPWVLVSSAVMLALALALGAHVLRTMTTRRVTLRDDAVRVERHFAGIPMLSKLGIFAELKAVLLVRRGPFTSIILRSEGRRTAVSLPFEDPRVAGWLSGRIHRAAHDAIRPGRAAAREG